EGGAPPEAALVLGVGPEVVEVLPSLDHAGDAVLGVEDLADLVLERGRERLARRVAGIARLVELRLRRGIALTHPGQGVLAGDLLEPLVGVGAAVGGGQLRCALGHRVSSSDAVCSKAVKSVRVVFHSAFQASRPSAVSMPLCSRPTVLRSESFAVMFTERREPSLTAARQ